MTKLAGKGGAVRLSEQLRDLGVKSTKQIPADLLQKNEEAEEASDSHLPTLALPSMSVMPLTQATPPGVSAGRCRSGHRHTCRTRVGSSRIRGEARHQRLYNSPLLRAPAIA
jgi:hypothetical protein